MKEETKELTEIQNEVYGIMSKFVEKFKDRVHTDIILMNLSTISKEINSMINESIIGKTKETDEPAR